MKSAIRKPDGSPTWPHSVKGAPQVGWPGALLLATGIFAFASPGRCADVVINPYQTYQTITGWGHGGGILGGTAGASSMLPPALADSVNYQYLDYLLDDLGLTGTRTWEVGPRIDGTGNDHGDCDVVDMNLFEADTLAPSDAAYLLYYQNRILAEGIQPSFYSSPGYPTHASDQKPWVMNHPGERAQQIWASALYLKTNYGINIAYSVIYNEPSFSYSILADDIKALGPRLPAQGLATGIQYAEAVAPQTDWGYFTPVLNDSDLWPWVGRISYHNYGTADPYRSYLRDFGITKGLTTAQTEMGNPTFDDLYSDLTLAGVSYWEVAYSANATLVPSGGLTSFTPSSTYFRMRQLMHYVRPGAVRIGAVSSDPSVRVLAFSRSNTVTTVIENTGGSAQTVNLSGLPAGSYGLSQSASGASSFQELGVRTVGAGGTLSVSVNGGSSVATLYPYSGANHPPTIMVWGSNPGYLAPPTNTATLSVTASDPELNSLTYHWTVTNQPTGASATITSPTNATTTVSGLTVAGTYVFNIDVRDGVNTTSKQVYLVVYDSNPPPVLGQTGFRIAAPYGLVFGPPTNTTHAYIEQPLSTVTLQAGIGDLANDDFTGRGQWSLVSQPPGASVTVSNTVYIFVSIRANVTGMTVPGDYVFQLIVTNPAPPNLTNQIICTVNAASSGPVISSITPSPGALTLPVSASQLSAVTSDPNNQLLRHWWVVKTAPAGAKPMFDHQGLPATTVSNLVIPGSYTFTLRCFDDIHMTNKDVSLSVSPTPGAPVINSPATAAVTSGTPFTYLVTANGGPTNFNASGLPPGLTLSNAVISGTPLTAGVWNIQISAANASGTGYGNLALTVRPPLPVITSPANADGLVSNAFFFTLQASDATLGFGAAGLPGGLVLDSVQGTITGTPTNAGVYIVSIDATNTAGTTPGTLTIVIYNGTPLVPVITSATNATGAVGMNFGYAITAANNPTGFFAIGLPAGLSFDPANGGITGAPVVAGAFNVTLRASNRGGTTSTNLAITINAEPQPQLGASWQRNGINLSFPAPLNHHYSVEWAGVLQNPGNWTDLISGIPGDGTYHVVTDPATNTTRFYRLKVSTP